MRRPLIASCALTLLVSVFLPAPPASGDEEIGVKNWIAPPYWTPQAENTDQRERTALAGRQALATFPVPLPFVAVAPCRVADTRIGSGFTGEFGPPALIAQATRTFTIGGQCGIPASAQAVSFLFTTVNQTAAGSLRAFPVGASIPLVGGAVVVWAATTPGAVIDAAVEPVGGVPGQLNVNLNGPVGTTVDLVIDINGYYSPQGVVNSLNTLFGDLTLTAGNNVTITPAGQTLNIAAAMPSGAIVFGKAGDTTLVGQGFTEFAPMATETWTPTSMTNVPQGRFWHCSAWTGTKMFVWGGQDNTQVPIYNSGGLYDPATDSWTATSTGSGVPTARRYAHCAWTGSEVLVWGGEDASLVGQNTGSRYDPVADTWAAMNPSGAPAGRSMAAAVWAATASPPRMLIWGGFDRVGPGQPIVYPATGGSYNPVNDSWSPISTASQPAPRVSHSFAWTGSKLVVWGGYSSPAPPWTYYSDGGRYDPSTDTWAPTAATGLSARYAAAGLWTGSRMVVWGGVNSSGVPVGDGALYDPAGDAWTSMTNTGAPDGRYSQVAVWTGSRMIIWSGMTAGGVTKGGGIYDPVGNAWRTMTLTNAPAANYGYTGHWTGLPLNEMAVWGGYGSVGGTYRTLSMFIKN